MKKNKTTITLFHCINAFTESDAAPFADHPDYEMKFVAMACSGMVKDVFLLRAFEAGSEAVVVLVCPDDQCRHVEGSLRARKRVERTKQILEEIGMDPLEVGEKVLSAIRQNKLYIITHPEFEKEIRRRSEALLAAVPDEDADPRRVAMEDSRPKLKY